MNTLKIPLLAAVCTFIMYSCNENDSPPKIDPPTRVVYPTKDISGRFILSKSGEMSKNEKDRIEQDVHMEGKGELNGLGPATLQLEHHEVLELIEHKINMNDGEFRLWNENGTELYGEYSGTTNTLSENLVFSVEIDGGTGEFENGFGRITIELIKQGNLEYHAYVRGTVRLKVGNQPVQ